MKEYYGQLDAMSKEAGGPYRLSSILIKRVRQLVRGSVTAFRSRGFNPVDTAFAEFRRAELQVAKDSSSVIELLDKKDKKGKKGKK
jgi:DNA-directed RNA polymerase subunit K/omega